MGNFSNKTFPLLLYESYIVNWFEYAYLNTCIYIRVYTFMVVCVLGCSHMKYIFSDFSKRNFTKKTHHCFNKTKMLSKISKNQCKI